MKRKKKYGKAILVDTFSIYITVRSKGLPNSVYLRRARLGLETYIPAIQQCYKCDSLGHISKSCKNKESCLIGSQKKHAEGTCMLLPSCINCKGGHEALDQSCPKIQESKEIKKMMAHDNIPFIVARKIFEGNKVGNKWNISIKNQNNFPTLGQKDAIKELSQRHPQSPKGFQQGTHSLHNNRARLLKAKK
jgi:hypothetical protein